ncbi:hypothetical protein B0H67DRAFT_648506 [Lasiosphaeris hirsuta]|uniref:Uncharacterized protein n=1 Tax=Lasiosphaeris hirsuta TaxID=260670 RepID=A0AA40A365_9PEZI|nr:hypothetical protein B0H67DRAFT_648506 [Lasiosphaeris hirsuta]
MPSSFEPPDFLSLDLSGKPDMSDFVRSKRARHRFTEHSSSDSSGAGTFLVSSVKFRETFGTSLQDQAEIIAKAEGVEPLSVELLARFVPGLGSDGRSATILIVAEWNEASPLIWESIVKKTKKFVDSSTRGASLEDEVCVEMIARELTLPNQEQPVSPWSNWASPKSLNEIPNNVYVSVDYESEESKWPPVVGEMQQLLNRYPHNLHVHMEHNTTMEFHSEFP